MGWVGVEGWRGACARARGRLLCFALLRLAFCRALLCLGGAGCDSKHRPRPAPSTNPPPPGAAGRGAREGGRGARGVVVHPRGGRRAGGPPGAGGGGGGARPRAVSSRLFSWQAGRRAESLARDTLPPAPKPCRKHPLPSSPAPQPPCNAQFCPPASAVPTHPPSRHRNHPKRARRASSPPRGWRCTSQSATTPGSRRFWGVARAVRWQGGLLAHWGAVWLLLADRRPPPSRQEATPKQLNGTTQTPCPPLAVHPFQPPPPAPPHLRPPGAVQPVPLAAFRPARRAARGAGGGEAQGQAQGTGGGRGV